MSRKLTVSEIKEGALDLALRKRVAIVCFVVAQIVLAVGLVVVVPTSGAGEAVSGAIGFAISIVFQSVLTLALGDRLPDMVSNPVELFTRLVFALAVFVIQVVCFATAALFLIVPGIYLAARWFIALPLVLLEGAEILESLKRSWKLTGESAWNVAIVLVMLFIVEIGQSSLPTSGLFAELAAIVLVGLIGSLFAAFWVATEVFVYRELAS